MKKIKIIANTKNEYSIHIANNFVRRFLGLMGKSQREVEKLGGLMIKPCAQIHTFFMKVCIDVIYVGKDDLVISVQQNVLPSKCCKRVKGAKYVIELPVGMAEQLDITKGSKLLYRSGE
jgi:hypothetical protein